VEDVSNVESEDILRESVDTLENGAEIVQADREAALEGIGVVTTTTTNEGN
jgi:hypothetical protein